jgi:GNAT superfamily N-acetyltransferase
MKFVDQSLASRLEGAQAGRMRQYILTQARLHPDRGCVAQKLAGGYLLYAGEGSPLNRAVGLGMDSPVSSADLVAVEAFYRSRNALPRVDLCPHAPPSLLEGLQEAGYTIERFSNISFCPLPAETASIETSPAVRITLALPEQADLWLRTAAQGFEGVAEPSAGLLDLLAPNFYAEGAYPFFAWLGDQPAGGGGMYLHNGIAEFGGASTRVEYRNQGVQTALLKHRLEAAAEAGCDLALIVATPGTASQGNAERLGFRLAYTKAVMVSHS